MNNPLTKRVLGFFRFILKYSIILLFLCYIFVGGAATVTVFQKFIINRQDISLLNTVIDKALEEGDTRAVTQWVRLRPLAETQALIDIVTPKSSGLNSGIFFELSQRQLLQGNTEEALFWAQLGRYRLRFDAIRCGPVNSHEIIDKAVSLFPVRAIDALLQEHPELVEKSVRRVLDFDARYPARNDPAPVCDAINKFKRSSSPVIPEDQWEPGRLMLREATETILNKTP